MAKVEKWNLLFLKLRSKKNCIYNKKAQWILFKNGHSRTLFFFIELRSRYGASRESRVVIATLDEPVTQKGPLKGVHGYRESE